MNWKSSRASAFGPLAMLATMFFLAGCQQLTTTRTGAIEADSATATGVCEVWLSVTYSSRDTEQTQREARANNAAREAYCHE